MAFSTTLTRAILAAFLLAITAQAQTLLVVTNERSEVSGGPAYTLSGPAGGYRITYTVTAGGEPIDLNDGSTFRLEVWASDSYRLYYQTNTTAPDIDATLGQLRFLISTLGVGSYRVRGVATPVSGDTNENWNFTHHMLTVTSSTASASCPDVYIYANGPTNLNLLGGLSGGITGGTFTLDASGVSGGISNLVTLGTVTGAVDAGTLYLTGTATAAEADLTSLSNNLFAVSNVAYSAATGTPLYAESDPVWSASEFATNTAAGIIAAVGGPYIAQKNGTGTNLTITGNNSTEARITIWNVGSANTNVITASTIGLPIGSVNFGGRSLQPDEYPWLTAADATSNTEIVNYRTVTNLIANLSPVSTVLTANAASYDAATKTLTLDTNDATAAAGSGWTNLVTSGTVTGAFDNAAQTLWLTGTAAAASGGGNLFATNTPSAGQMVYASEASNSNLYWAAAPASSGSSLIDYVGGYSYTGGEAAVSFAWTNTGYRYLRVVLNGDLISNGSNAANTTVYGVQVNGRSGWNRGIIRYDPGIDAIPAFANLINTTFTNAIGLAHIPSTQDGAPWAYYYIVGGHTWEFVSAPRGVFVQGGGLYYINGNSAVYEQWGGSFLTNVDNATRSAITSLSFGAWCFTNGASFTTRSNAVLHIWGMRSE